MRQNDRPTLDHVLLVSRTDNTIMDVCEIEYQGTGTMSPGRYRLHKLKTFFAPRTAESLFVSILPPSPGDDEFCCYAPSGARRYYTAHYTDKQTAERWRDIIGERPCEPPYYAIAKRHDEDGDEQSA